MFRAYSVNQHIVSEVTVIFFCNKPEHNISLTLTMFCGMCAYNRHVQYLHTRNLLLIFIVNIFIIFIENVINLQLHSLQKHICDYS